MVCGLWSEGKKENMRAPVVGKLVGFLAVRSV
ncbi:hypothetical protein Ferp_0483 [Ferroglobus placidus DSM 10642]|uniref:Uncharacterized protein n=1 Tax=Ferroglobus placidus (strain DSM 10642 / AEDII12DO) TaxID=589924 RepID=D3S324_FERPA|nr:hypothetical protein Ferp_0483 [Ferroglobus placidus DSM 10642]